MINTEAIKGFSRLSKQEKMEFFANQFENPKEVLEELISYFYKDPQKQKLFDEFSENTISNFYLPYGVLPELRINDTDYMIPLVIEECSVVAAASNGAKFWNARGGFHAEVIGIKKIGQVHFVWKGEKQKLLDSMGELRQLLLDSTMHITSNMVARGGGITDIELVDLTHEIPNYYQIKATFDTRDSMGANFINSCLEEFSYDLKLFFESNERFTGAEKECSIIMAILSNYTPECLVRTWVECDISELEDKQHNISAKDFATKFEHAVKIAEIDVHRATTHNKGIFNGIDAVAIATGNDFRAIEACGHAYASRSGKYSSLTKVEIIDNKFRYILEVPLAMGTVGGITALHPLAKRSIEVLGRPNAETLMMIAASVGLANNFSAVRALITHGIQKGHMKMHLSNILNYLDATLEEKVKAYEYFKHNKVSFKTGTNFIMELRKGKLNGNGNGVHKELVNEIKND